MTKHTARTLQAAFKYLFPDEIPFLKLLARSLPEAPLVINIGAGAGTSGLAFAESRDDLILYTIDIRKEDSPLGCLNAEKKVLQEAGLWDSYRTIQWHDDSREAAKGWLILADMIFIDDGHEYEEAKGDIEGWLPHLKEGGIIAVHDYKKGELFESETDFQPDKPHPKAWPGVDRAVDELLLDVYEYVGRVDSLIAFRNIKLAKSEETK